MKSKLSECPDFSCSRSDGTLEPVTSSFLAGSESLRANSQSSAVVQPVRPPLRSFSQVRVQSRKTRCHGKSPLSQSCICFLTNVILCTGVMLSVSKYYEMDHKGNNKLKKFSKGQTVSVNYNMNGLELLANIYLTTGKWLLAKYQTLLLLENDTFNFDC